MNARTSSDPGWSRFTAGPHGVMYASVKYGPNVGEPVARCRRGCRPRRGRRPGRARGRRPRTASARPGPPYGSCTAHRPIPSYPQPCWPGNAATGISSTRVHAELAQVVQPPDGRVQRPLRGERADVQLVDHRPAQRRAAPAAVGPGEGRRGRRSGSARRCRTAAAASAGRAAARRRPAGTRSRSRPLTPGTSASTSRNRPRPGAIG